MNPAYLKIFNDLWIDFSQALVDHSQRLPWAIGDLFLIKITRVSSYFEPFATEPYCVEVVDFTRQGAFEDLSEIFGEMMSGLSISLAVCETFSVTVSQIDG